MEPISVAGPAGRLTGWIKRGNRPDAVPVLLVHPINMQGRIWAGMVDHLDPSRTYLMPDLRAHGSSDAVGDFGLEPWTDDLEAVLDHCGVHGAFHVVGGSVGGSLACVLAGRRPTRAISVAGIGSSLSFEVTDVASVLAVFDELGVAGTFRKVFPEMTFGPGCATEIVELGLSLTNPNDTETVKRVWHSTITSDSTAVAMTLDTTALVLTGSEDATCTPALGLEMAAVLRTEQTVMPGIGHMPMLECPRRTAVLLERHLELAERAHRFPNH